MAKLKITFSECIQDSQEYGSNEEHMVSRVFFRLEVDGHDYGNHYCDIKQTVGSSYATGPIEVSGPKGGSYKGPFNYEAFRKAAEGYYRGLVGPSGSYSSRRRCV